MRFLADFGSRSSEEATTSELQVAIFERHADLPRCAPSTGDPPTSRAHPPPDSKHVNALSRLRARVCLYFDVSRQLAAQGRHRSARSLARREAVAEEGRWKFAPGPHRRRHRQRAPATPSSASSDGVAAGVARRRRGRLGESVPGAASNLRTRGALACSRARVGRSNRCA